MRTAFDDAEVSGWEALEGTFGLPNPDDEHLVAAAVVGGAGAIVTHNAADLPADRLPAGIKVVAPAQFAADTVSSTRSGRWWRCRQSRRGPGGWLPGCRSTTFSRPWIPGTPWAKRS